MPTERFHDRSSARPPRRSATILAAHVAAALAATATMSVARAAAPAEAPLLDTVVVTAERRAVAAYDVPVSLTAIDSETLDQFAIHDFASYGSLVPGLSGQVYEGEVQNRGPRTVGLRGVQTQNLSYFGGQNTVGFYINETPVPVVNPRLVDLERIEVLRGPQGTLYGSSSLGGTVRLLTKTPKLGVVEGRVAMDNSFTNEGGYNNAIEGSVNLPLGSIAALRANGYYETLSGYIDFQGISPLNVLTNVRQEDANDGKSYGGMLSVLIAPNDVLTITPSVIYSKRESDMADFFNAGQFVQVNHFLQQAEDQFTFADLRVDWKLGSGTLTSATAYFDMASVADRDVTDFFAARALPAPALIPFDTTIDQREFTHETRFVSDFKGPWQFVAGVFYTDRKEESASRTVQPAITSLFGLPVVNGDILTVRSPRNRKEFALFGQTSYEINEQWKVSAGLRWFDQKFDGADDGSGLFASPDAKSAGSESGSRYMGRVEYRPTGTSMYYATVATGFRMGGSNFPLISPLCDQGARDFFGPGGAPSTYEPDSLTNYELGGKLRFADDRATLSASVYLVDWKDTQVPVQLGAACPVSGLSGNAGSVESYGFELELGFEPIESWNVWLGIASVNAEVKEDLAYPGAVVVVARKGTALPDIPEWTFSLTSDYGWSIGAEWDAFVRADFRYSGSQPIDFANSSRREAVELLNARVGVKNDRWEAALFVNNVLDSAPSLGPFTFGGTAGGGRRASDYTIRPRTIGARIGWRF